MPNHKTSGGLTIGASDGDNFETFDGTVVFSGSYYGLCPVIGFDGLVIKGKFF